MISLEVSGLKDVINKLEKTGNEDLVNSVIEDTGKLAIEKAKQLAPELTGEMAGDIQGERQGHNFILECLVPWATFNEYGSIYMKVGSIKNPLPVQSGSGKHAFRPFMRPAIYWAMKQTPQIFRNKLVRIWK